MRPGKTPVTPGTQRGLATLMIGLTLLMGSSVLTLAMVRGNLMEQRIANNELRAKEAQQAAQSGLDYALAWLSHAPWTPGQAPPQPPPILGSGDHVYRIDLAISTAGDCLRVHAEASAASDESIRAMATECIEQRRLLKQEVDAPLVIRGCPLEILGELSVFSRSCQHDPEGEPDPQCQPVAMLTDDPNGCPDRARLTLIEPMVAIRDFGDAGGTAWDQVFAIGKSELKALAEDPDSNVHWISSPTPWRHDLGSPAQPGILVFDATAGCPVFADQPTLYGIVYSESSADCLDLDWDGTRLFGTLILESSLRRLSGQVILHHWSLSAADPASRDRVYSARRVPGSWRDWDASP